MPDLDVVDETFLVVPPKVVAAVFAEPTGWFEGANLLRSKLPLVVQNNVRNMRREWLKGK